MVLSPQNQYHGSQLFILLMYNNRHDKQPLLGVEQTISLFNGCTIMAAPIRWKTICLHMVHLDIENVSSGEITAVVAKWYHPQAKPHHDHDAQWARQYTLKTMYVGRGSGRASKAHIASPALCMYIVEQPQHWSTIPMNVMLWSMDYLTRQYACNQSLFYHLDSVKVA